MLRIRPVSGVIAIANTIVNHHYISVPRSDSIATIVERGPPSSKRNLDMWSGINVRYTSVTSQVNHIPIFSRQSHFNHLDSYKFQPFTFKHVSIFFNSSIFNRFKSQVNFNHFESQGYFNHF